MVHDDLLQHFEQFCKLQVQQQVVLLKKEKPVPGDSFLKLVSESIDHLRLLFLQHQQRVLSEVPSLNNLQELNNAMLATMNNNIQLFMDEINI